MCDHPYLISVHQPGDCVAPWFWRSRPNHAGTSSHFLWLLWCWSPQSSSLTPKPARAVLCFGGPLRILTPLCALFFFVEWSGINALLYYGPTLVKEIGLKGDTVSLVVSGGIGIVQFIAVLPAIAYIDKIGRKALLRGSCSSRFTFPSVHVLLSFPPPGSRSRLWFRVGLDLDMSRARADLYSS